jgi:hypothetical protein
MTTTPTYHKIQSVFKRDEANHYKTFLMDEFAEESFSYLQDANWRATEKIDGTNTRIHFNGDSYTIGGRTENAELHVDLVQHLQAIGHQGNTTLDGLTLYGEGYGAGIQKGGGNYRPDKGFILFDVLAVESNMWLKHEDVEDIAKTLDIPVAQWAWMGTLNNAVEHFASKERIPSFERDTEAEGWSCATGAATESSRS